MSLTQLAIDNLIARPSGNLALSHRRGLTLPAWLTPDFITRRGGLIEQLDIGTTYPRYLQQELLGTRLKRSTTNGSLQNRSRRSYRSRRYSKCSATKTA
ncbi:hypothetical protein THH46_18510 [Pseudomonas sp. NA13]